MTAGRRPTLRQVADRSRVALKTASRAINGEPNVAPETAARVFAAARELGFRPNALARELRSRRQSATVGLVIADLANPFYSAIAAAVERVLHAHGLLLITASHEEDADRQRDIVHALVERRIAALLIVPADGDADYLAAELAMGVRVVALDRPLVGVRTDTVLLDNRGGSAAATAELLSRGHRRIGFLGDSQRLWTVRERLAGYTATLQGAGIAADPELIRTGAHHTADAEGDAAGLLSAQAPPTAVFAANNIALLGLLRAARALDAAVEVVGFDRFEPADIVYRPVGFVDSDPAEMGRLAAERVVRPSVPDDDDDVALITVATRLVQVGARQPAPAGASR